MSDDLIERADAISLNCNVWERIAAKCDLWPDLLAALKAEQALVDGLVAALKAERAENEQLRGQKRPPPDKSDIKFGTTDCLGRKRDRSAPYGGDPNN